MSGSMATVGLQTAPHDVTEFFMTTHRKPFYNYARLQKDYNGVGLITPSQLYLGHVPLMFRLVELCRA